MFLHVADVIWPALFVEDRLFSLWPICLGLLVEFFFVRWLTTLSLGRCVVADCTMNAISALLGIFLLPIAGIAWEVFPGILIYKVFHVGTFNPGTWAATFLFAVAINAALESAVLRFIFQQRQPYRRLFWWLCVANSLSVALAFVSLYLHPPHHP